PTTAPFGPDIGERPGRRRRGGPGGRSATWRSGAATQAHRMPTVLRGTRSRSQASGRGLAHRATDDQDLRGPEAGDAGGPAVDHGPAAVAAEERGHLAFLLVRVGAVDALDAAVLQRHLVAGHGVVLLRRRYDDLPVHD